MKLTEALARVHSAPTENFVDLVAESGLDPASHFRFANFEGMDFSNCDLKGFNFTGCDFTKATLGNASFRGAIIKDALFRQNENPRNITRKALELKRTKIMRSVSNWLGDDLHATNKTCFENSDQSVRVACTISKRYDNRTPYWFAYHRIWDEFLENASKAYFVLGCMDLEKAFLIPRPIVMKLIPDLNMSETKRKRYWHIHVEEGQDGGYELVIPKKDNLSLHEFELVLRSS